MTPLDHNDVDKACNTLLHHAAAWLVAIVLSALVLSFTSTANAQHYDASFQQEQNAKHFETIQVYVLYESWVWKDRKHASHHIDTGTLPDGLDRMLGRIKPGQPILVDIESLPTGIYQKIGKKERLRRIEFLAKVVQSIKLQLADAGFGSSKIFWYGSTAMPGQIPTHRNRELRTAFANWLETNPRLHDQFDAFAVPSYHRWEDATQTSRMIVRTRLQAIIPRPLGKPVYAVLNPVYPPSHTQSALRKKPVDADLLLSHMQEVKSHFDGAMVWQGPFDNEEVRARRYLLFSNLTIMDK